MFSISLGHMFASLFDYFKDATSIGSFHVVQRGKVVIYPAGSDGSYPGTLSNMAPWIITVGLAAIVQPISRYCIGKMVIGSSSCNAITRRFKGLLILFCTIYHGRVLYNAS